MNVLLSGVLTADSISTTLKITRSQTHQHHLKTLRWSNLAHSSAPTQQAIPLPGTTRL